MVRISKIKINDANQYRVVVVESCPERVQNCVIKKKNKTYCDPVRL